MSESGRVSSDVVLFVNPADVDLPWVKAEAAKRDLSVTACPHVPRGQAFAGSLSGSLPPGPKVRP